MRVRCARGGLALAFLLLAWGCGSAKPVKVEGIVLLDGKPVEGATVSFVPDGETGRPADALTGPDGVFRLNTFSPEDGALPGDYRVVVIKTATGGAGSQPRGADQIKSMMMGGFKKAPPKDDPGKQPDAKDDPGKEPDAKKDPGKQPDARDDPGKKPDPTDEPGKQPDAKDKAGKQRPPSRPSLLPEIYGTFKTTPLRETVPTKGRVTLDLKSDAAPQPQ
jgi:hypothetical protein